MAEIETSSGIDEVRGKFKKADKGYFYIRNGKQFYRDREEDYQKNQSPKQKYNSAVFAYANEYMAEHYGTPEGKIRLAAEYEAAQHIGSNGKTYTTAWGWKFNSLQFEYRQCHPFAS